MWEADTVRAPRATTLHAIEHVTGLPADALGFETAAADLGADPAGPMSSDGPWIPVADPRVKPGPLSGIWLSDYTYHSTSREMDFHGAHYAVLIQHGSRIQVRSTPGSPSRLKIDMTLNGQIFNGTWAEETEPNGYYRGALYYGAIPMIGDPAGQQIEGKWVGFGKGGEVNDGPWLLKRLTGQVTTDDIARYSKPTDEDAA